MDQIGYRETEDKLHIRIKAHTQFASFKLDDWLFDWLGHACGQRLLEIGCGDGNFFSIYARALGEGGMIIGLDLCKDLLRKARQHSRALPTPAVFLPWNFDDHPWPLLDEEVDILIAPYSAYYSKDVPAWVEDALRVTRSGGRLLILGPTRNNAEELYWLNEYVYGIRTVAEIDETTIKLEASFLPELRERLGGNVRWTILDRQIIFPSAIEFARYYQATMLFDRTCQQLGRTITFEEVLAAAQKTNLRLNKQIICIEGRKP